MAFPTALDTSGTLPSPNTSDKTNSPSHAGLHGLENTAIIAVETKLGTGASTPTANTIMFGTGSGTSAWTQLTSAQLLASLTDETGTGSVVFANTPTLITPKVDTINESTPSNGVTVGGVNLKSGAVNTANSVNSAAIGTNTILANNLATNAITLGYAQVTTNQSTAATTDVQATGLTVTVTIPSGGRKVKITGYVSTFSNTAAAAWYLTTWDGTVGSGTQLTQSSSYMSTLGTGNFGFVQAIVTPAAGSKTYNLGIHTNTGTLTLNAGANTPAFILVEAI